MQATTQSIPFAVPSQSHAVRCPTLHPRLIVPTTFVQATRRGWKLVSEKTVLGADKRHRHGTLVLTRPGKPNLIVDYTGTIKQGYHFGKPRIA
jgi:hypothetical protein